MFFMNVILMKKINFMIIFWCEIVYEPVKFKWCASFPGLPSMVSK